VTVEIREWAPLREQVVLHHQAHLLEFASAAARQAALDANAAGSPVGDRFLLLAPTASPPRRFPKAIGAVTRIDYAKPLPPILRGKEAGLITMKEPPSDLLIEAQLDGWAEHTQEGRWQLTPDSVTAQVAAGARIDELIDLPVSRTSRPLPPLLELALRNWVGRRARSIELEPFTVLRCTNSAALHAILTSKHLRPYLRGHLGDDVLLFDSTQMDEVQKLLR